MICVVHVDCSQMLYPVLGKEEPDHQDQSQMMSGKYEPLVHMNALLSEQIRKAMSETAGKYVHDITQQGFIQVYSHTHA